MPNGGFELKLTDAQRDLLAKASDAEKLRLAYVKISKEIAEQQLDGSGAVNVWKNEGTETRPSYRRTSAGALPENPEVAIRFPGVDPRGKYSALDMKLAQRRAEIDRRLRMRSPEVRSFVTRDIMDSAVFRNLEREVDELARRQRIATRAQKVCEYLWRSDAPVPKQVESYKKSVGEVVITRNLHQEAQDLSANQAMVDMENALSGVECLLGIRPGPIPEASAAIFARDRRLAAKFTPELLEAARRSVVPTDMNVEFPNFAHKLLQLQFSKEENWGKKPTEFADLSADEIAALIPAYRRAAVGRTLDSVFDSVEALWKTPGTPPFLDRGDHIIVDGKTPREALLEEYRREGITDRTFDQYYLERGHEFTAELVAAALTADKRVEVFIPDKNGNIPDEPLRMTQTGFESRQLDRVALNVWERFWSRFGFYKEKTAQIEAQKATQAARAAEDAPFLESRERVRVYHRAAQIEMDSYVVKSHQKEFFGDWMAEKGFDTMPADSARGYSLTRSAWPTLAIMKLLGDGYELADIFDPNKLQAEKQAAGRAVAEKVYLTSEELEAAKRKVREEEAAALPEGAEPKQLTEEEAAAEEMRITAKAKKRSGDPEWEKRMFEKGIPKFFEGMDKLAKQLDLTNSSTYFSQDFRTFCRAACMGGDASQEYGTLLTAMGLKPARGPHKYEKVLDDMSRCYLLTASVEKLLKARSNLALGNYGEQAVSEIEGFLEGHGAMMIFEEAMCESNGKNLFRAFDDNVAQKLLMNMTDSFVMCGAKDAGSVLTDSSKTPEFREQIRKAAIDGSLASEVTIKRDESGPKLRLPSALERVIAPFQAAYERSLAPKPAPTQQAPHL